MALQLTVFKTNDEAAQALAQAVSKDLHRALAEDAQQRALLLVSGGRSPLPFFAALAQQPLPWGQIDVSLVDERSVPPDHPDANAALVSEHLLQGAARAARLLPLIAADLEEDDPWRRAQRAAELANDRPELARPAAIVLGLGTDGHTASLFRDAPQWEEACTTGRRYVALQPAHAPHARVSLSLSALIAQRTCYVWSNGAAKLAVIRQAQALAHDEGGGTAESAGAFALLAADLTLLLRVFHSEQ